MTVINERLPKNSTRQVFQMGIARAVMIVLAVLGAATRGQGASSVSLTSITPNSAPVDSGSVSLTASGTNLSSGSNVVFTSPDGYSFSLPTTFINSVEVQATIPATYLVTAGAAQVAVQDGGTFSNGLPFTVQPISLTSLTPNSAAVGSNAVSFTANGANIPSGATITFTPPVGSPVSLPMTFVNSAQVQATIPASYLVTAGTAQVAIQDGSTISNSLPFGIFSIYLTSLTPNGAAVGSGPVNVTANGSGIPAGASITFTPPGGAAVSLPSTFVSSAQMQATIPASYLVSAGTAQVAIQNGSVFSNAVPFGIYSITLTSITPSTAAVGSGPVNLTANGSGIPAGASITFTPPGGSAVSLPSTFVSSAQLQATIPATYLVTAGTAQVAIQGGSAFSNTLLFSVQSVFPLPAISGLSPQSATAGGSAFTLTVNGSNFTSGVIVNWNGSPLPTTFVSSSQLTATVGQSLIASPGGAFVTVTTGAAASTPALFSITVAPLSLATTSIPNGYQSVVYPTTILNAQGGLKPYTWTATGLPAGLSLSTGGVLSGTPQQIGPFQASVTVTDSSTAPALTANRVFSGTIGSSGPLLTVTPSTLSFTYTQGDAYQPASQTIGVLSTPAGTAVSSTASTTDGANWLIIKNVFAAGSGQTPATVIVSVNPAGLAPNTYHGQISIAAPAATPSSSTVNVTFTVNPSAPPQLSVNATRQDFALVEGSASQQGQIRVSNSGGGTLQFTAQATTQDGNWLTLAGSSSGSATPSAPETVGFVVNPGSLQPGLYRGQITITDTSSGIQAVLPVTLAISNAVQTIQLSQTGVTFTAVVNGVSPPAQSFSVLNLGQGSMSWTTQTQTIPAGQSWLSATASGSSTPQSAGQSLVSVNPAGLGVGRYFGTVTVTAPNAANNPQNLSVQLNVVRAGDRGSDPRVETGGIVLAGVAGGPAAAQPVTLFNPQGLPLSYTTNVFTSDGGTWLSASPASGTLDQVGAGTLTIQGSLAGLTPGVRYGKVQVAFSQGTVRTIRVALIATSGSVPAISAVSPGGFTTASGCQSQSLVVSIQQPAEGQVVEAATAQALQVQLVDNCGTPFSGPGNVSVTFDNGDPAVALSNQGGGVWQGTWTPANAQTSVRVDAQATGTAANGAIVVGEDAVTSGAVLPASADAAPQPAGAFNAASLDPANAGVVVPGGYVTIYGTRLGDGVAGFSTLPLPFSLGNTQVLLGNQPLPLLFAGPTQVNALIPLNLPPNTSLQLFVVRDGTVSVPVNVTVTDLQPGIFTIAQSGEGQGAILVAGTSLVAGPQSSNSRPAQRGEYLEIFATGLGPVAGTQGEAPPADGVAAPASGSPLYETVGTASVTVGGVPAPVIFAGLAPGFVSFYQVNAQVPDGAPSGSAVPVVLTVTGANGSVSSRTVTIAVQ